MEIARLAVNIDPTGAVTGAKAAQTAANQLTIVVETMAKKVDESSKKASGAFTQMVAALKTGAAGVAGAFSQLANAAGMFAPRLGFALQSMQAMAAGAMAAVGALRNLAGGMKGAAGSVAAFALAAGSVVAVLGVVSAAVVGLTAVLLPLVIAWKAVGTAFDLVKEGFSLASDFETQTLRMATFVGGLDKAKARLEELAKFADSTPFALSGVIEANVHLQNFTQGLLAGADGMRMVGDAAAATQKPIQEVAYQIGRLYSGMKGGAPIDDALNTLVSMGAVLGSTRQKVMAAKDAGMAFGDMWKMVEKDLARTNGAMANIATTLGGRVSTMSDAWDKFKRKLAEPFIPAAKVIVSDLTAMIDRMTGTVEGWGPTIQYAADSVAATFRAMQQPGGFETIMVDAGQRLVDLLKNGFDEAGRIINEKLKAAGFDLEAQFERLKSASFWEPLGQVLYNVGVAFVNAILGKLDEKLSASAGTLRGGIFGNAYGAYKALGGTAPKLDYTKVNSPFAPDVQGLPTDGGMALGNFAPSAGYETDPSFVGPRQPGSYTPSLLPELDGPPTPTASDLIEAERRKIDAERKTEAAGMTFPEAPKPTDAEPPVKKATRVGRGSGGGQSAYEKMQSEAKSFVDSIKTPSQELDEMTKKLERWRDAGLITNEQFQQGVAKSKSDYIAAMEAAAQKSEEMATRGMSAFQKLMREWQNVGKGMDQANVTIAQSFADNVSGAITDVIMGTKSAAEAFQQMANAIISQIIKVIAQLLVQWAISAAMGMVAPVSVATPTVAAVHHDGGVVGDGRRRRTVASETFAGAMRYHTGGVAGLQPNETPAILQKGETVLTKGQADGIRDRLSRKKDTGTAGSKPVTIVNVQDPRQIADYLNSNPEAVLNVIGKNASAVRRILG